MPESDQPTPPAATPEPTPAPTPAPEKTVKVRVLLACEYGACNDVAELPASAVKAAESAGKVDSARAAVAYAASLPQNKPV